LGSCYSASQPPFIQCITKSCLFFLCELLDLSTCFHFQEVWSSCGVPQLFSSIVHSSWCHQRNLRKIFVCHFSNLHCLEDKEQTDKELTRPLTAYLTISLPLSLSYLLVSSGFCFVKWAASGLYVCVCMVSILPGVPFILHPHLNNPYFSYSIRHSFNFSINPCFHSLWP
jgi:hypothetical protein